MGIEVEDDGTISFGELAEALQGDLDEAWLAGTAPEDCVIELHQTGCGAVTDDEECSCLPVVIHGDRLAAIGAPRAAAMLQPYLDHENA